MKRRAWLSLIVLAACGEEQTAQSNRPPDLKVPGAQFVLETELLAFAVSAEDPDEDPVTLEAKGLPETAVFNAQSGQVLWTPGTREAGTYAFNFAASDGRFSVEGTVNVTVVDKNRPPALDGLSDLTISEGTPVALVVVASDPDGDSVTLAVNPIPAGATFQPATGLLSWTPGYGQSGVYVLVFTAQEQSAAALLVSHPVTITVLDVNRAPAFDDLPRVAAKEGELLDYVVPVSDADSDVVDLVADALPPGAAFEVTARRLTWTPTLGQAGVYNIPFSATDRHGAGSRTTSTALVVDVEKSNRPPVLEPIADRVLAETQTLAFSLQASDQDSDQTLTFAAVGLPAGAELDGPNFTWTPGCNANGTYTVQFTASDGIDTASRTVRLTVNNTNCPPRLSPIGARSVLEGTPLTLVLGVDDEDVEGYEFTASGAPGATMDPTVGLFNWTPSYEQGGAGEVAYPVVFTVTDRGFPPLSDSITETITVRDNNRAPAFDPLGSQTVFEREVVSILVTAHDPDGDAITEIVASGAPFARPNSDAAVTLFPATGGLAARLTWKPTCRDGGADVQDYTVTFVAKDAKGGTGSTVASVTVKNVDCEPTLTISPPSDSTSETGLVTMIATADDPDGAGIIELSVSGGPANANYPQDGTAHNRATFSAAGDRRTGTFTWRPGCADQGAYVETFTAVDATGRTTSKTAGIQVTPRACLPVVTAPDAVTGDEASPITFQISARDMEGQQASIAPSGAPAGSFVSGGAGTLRTDTFMWTPTCKQAGTYPVIFDVTGSAGGTVTKTVQVVVRNINCAPVLSPPGFSYTSETVPVSMNAIASDPDGDPLTSFTVTGPPFSRTGSNAAFTVTPETGGQRATFTWTPGCRDNGEYTLTFSVSDGQTEASTTGSLTVGDVDCPPVLTLSKSSDSTSETGLSTFTIAASDPDGLSLGGLYVNGPGLFAGGGDTVEYGLTTFTESSDHTSGSVTWRPGCRDSGSYTFYVQAQDAGYQSTQKTVQVTVSPVLCRPYFVKPPTATGVELSEISYAVEAKDPESDQEPNISWTPEPAGGCHDTSLYGRSCGPPPVYASTRFSWTPSCIQQGSYSIVYTGTPAASSPNAGFVFTGNVGITVGTTNCPGTVESIVPWTSPIEGGRTITVCGTGLFPGSQVLVTGSSGTEIITATTPFAGSSACPSGAGLRFVTTARSQPAVVAVTVDNMQGTPIPPTQAMHYYRLSPVGGINWGRMRALAGSWRDPNLFAALYSSAYSVSADGASTWSRMGSQQFLYSERDFLAFDALTDTTLYSAASNQTLAGGDVSVSTDQGRNWSKMENPVGVYFPDMGCASPYYHLNNATQYRPRGQVIPPVPLSGMAPAKGGGVLVLSANGCGQGLWRSPRGAGGWELKNGSGATSLPPGVSYLATASAPSNPDSIMVVVDDGARAFRSINGGDAWSESTSLGSLILALAFDPQDSRHLFALTFGGVKESTNFGDTWVDRAGFLGRVDMAVARGSAQSQATVMVSGDTFVEVSTNNGATVSRTTVASDRKVVAATATRALFGYAPANPPGKAEYSGPVNKPLSLAAQRSTNGGTTWVDASTDLSGASVDRLFFTKSGAAVAISASTLYYRPATGPSPRRFTRSAGVPTQWIKEAFPSDAGTDTVFVLGEGTDWIFRSTNLGASFTSVTPPYSGVNPVSGYAGRMAMMGGSSPGRIHAMVSNGFYVDGTGTAYYEPFYERFRWMMQSTNDGTSWLQLDAQSEDTGTVNDNINPRNTRLWVDRVNHNFLWFVQTECCGDNGQVLWRSTNYGATLFHERPAGVQINAYVPVLFADRFSTGNPDTRLLMIAGNSTGDGYPLIARNGIGGVGGASSGWSAVTYPLVQDNFASYYNYQVRAFGQPTPDPARPLTSNVVFAGGTRGMMVSTDRGVSWRRLHVLDETWATMPSAIEPDPNRYNTVLVGTKDQVQYGYQFNPGYGAGAYELEIILP